MTGVRTDRGDVEAEVVVNCAGQWAAPVGAMAGVARAAALGRALLRRHRPDRGRRTRTCRSCATRTARPTSRRRSAAWWSAASSPRPSRGCRPTQIPYPFEFALLDEDWEHFAVLMDSALHRIPVLARDRDPQVLQRPRELHPRQPVPDGRGARTCAASSSAPASTRSASRRPAAPAGRWPSGSSRASRPATWSSVDIRRFAPFAAQRPAGCASGSWRCSACTTPCRGRTASSRRARPFALLAAARPAGRPQAPCFGSQDGLGAGQRLRAGRDVARTLDYSWGKPDWLPWSAAEQRATRDGGRGLRPDVVLEVPRHGPRRRGRPAVDLHRRRRRSRSARSSTPALLNRARHLRVRPDRDPGRRRRVPPGQQLGHHRARPRLDPAARPRRATTPGSST